MGNCVSILGDNVTGLFSVGFLVGRLVSSISVGLYVVGCIVGFSSVSVVGDDDESVTGEGGALVVEGMIKVILSNIDGDIEGACDTPTPSGLLVVTTIGLLVLFVIVGDGDTVSSLLHPLLDLDFESFPDLHDLPLLADELLLLPLL